MSGSIEGRPARGSLLFVSGQISSWNGELRHRGKVGAEVANGASDLLVDLLGATAGGHARFAVGAGSLPFNVAVELAAVLEVS